MKMNNRVVLITGASSGIGLELARQLMALGNTVIITGRDREKLNSVQALLPGIHTFQSDVSDPESIRSLFLNVSEQFANLDILINNAGVMRNIRLKNEFELVNLTQEIDINLNGPIWMIQQFLPLLLKQPESMIVNISSGLAFVPFPAAPIYSAAKSALHAYTRCLRAQLKQSSVSVVEVAPPGTETPLYRDEFAQEMKGTKGMEVALLVRLAIKGIEAGKPEIRPGLSNVLKIASRIAPASIFRQMTRMSQLFG
ncbi:MULTISPECIES: SDR family oxidoreductase [Pseudomonas]|uniref:SDR family NAD(P)-dependent oxidoreductase n=1 Tax=Pseudomonas gingeri TaxID=117681 RepID=A0A7Y7WN52_9PSED|nr:MULTISPECIES: SDR family NAD(P)-dependent oxidoreductase [Pseudomonas]NWB84262.1 SDR family NAD(P)-dependent oxidoreductase [Pseudomonas gingeri]